MPWSPAPRRSSRSTPWAMSGDCPCSVVTTLTWSVNRYSLFVYPTWRIVSRTIASTSTSALVVTSPITWTKSRHAVVSMAARVYSSCDSIESSMESEIWSHSLSGCAGVTHSLVKHLVMGRPPRDKGMTHFWPTSYQEISWIRIVDKGRTNVMKIHHEL